MTGEVRRDADLDKGSIRVTNLDVGVSGEPVTRPVYLPGHVAWEHCVDHHDAAHGHPLTSRPAAGRSGVRAGLWRPGGSGARTRTRGRLFSWRGGCTPVIAGVIVEMTELVRAKRAQDASLIRRLETCSRSAGGHGRCGAAGLEKAGAGGRGAIIQTHLRDRLFEISRRNRLIYFKPHQSTLNLAVASVPLVLDHRNIQPEQLLYWHEAVAREVCAGRGWRCTAGCGLPGGRALHSRAAGQADQRGAPRPRKTAASPAAAGAGVPALAQSTRRSASIRRCCCCRWIW